MNGEYISREDILDIALQYCPDDDGICSKADRDIRDMLDEIEAIPAADVQPVVHCKDCKYRKERHYEESGEKPYIKYECKFTKYSMSDDGFCSFGAKMLEKPNLQLLKDAVELIKKAKEIKSKQE